MSARKTAAPGFNEFRNNLNKGKLPDILLFHGVEQLVVSWAVGELRERFVSPAMRSVDYVVLESPTPEEIIDACETFSMMSEKRLVWVPNFRPLKSVSGIKGYGEDSLEKLIRYISDPNKGTIAVFSYDEIDGRSRLVKALKKQGGEYVFNQLTNGGLKSFATKRFERAGKKISDSHLAMLIQMTGYLNKESNYHLFNFDNDIRKIIAHSSGAVITEEDLRAAVSGEGDTFIFDLLDGISGNDKSGALEILNNKIKRDTYSSIPTAAAIISQVELMMEIREFMDDPTGPSSAAAISRYTGIHSFRVEKAMRYASRYSVEKLRKMLKDSYETYAALLTGEIPPQLALEMFIARI